MYVNQGDFDRNIAKYLARAQSLREDADYDAVDGITESIAKLWINNAEEFMEESKRFLYIRSCFNFFLSFKIDIPDYRKYFNVNVCNIIV